jgi:Polyketide cyclase / dehydrase and lipid transport
MKRKVQPVQVYVSSVIDAQIDKVWSVVRDFNALPKWHPAIAESSIEAGRESSDVGCIRSFALANGAKIREQLLALSDTQYRFAYAIIESDVGLLDYVAEMELHPVTDGDRTFVAWSANFRTQPGLEHVKGDIVAKDVFLTGLEALKARLGRK